MTINTISRSEINVSEKYEPLIRALRKLEKDGPAIQVTVDEISEFNSLENIMLEFNREHQDSIKSSKHSDEEVIFFYK